MKKWFKWLSEVILQVTEADTYLMTLSVKKGVALHSWRVLLLPCSSKVSPLATLQPRGRNSEADMPQQTEKIIRSESRIDASSHLNAVILCRTICLLCLQKTVALS